jgi:3-deoxy-D-manno-octulosonate 8-phosphate phosphatase (KDO 8-P phosphatase)
MENNIIKMFIMDVDGTLTDGKIYIGEHGELFKTFNVKDGYGIDLLKKHGIIPVIITGRKSNIVLQRAKELGIQEVYQGINNKIEVYEELKEKYRLLDNEIAYIGDDLNDLALMRKVGIKFTVANCANELSEIADFKSHLNGGEGAVRDAINHLLNKK